MLMVSGGSRRGVWGAFWSWGRMVLLVRWSASVWRIGLMGGLSRLWMVSGKGIGLVDAGLWLPVLRADRAEDWALLEALARCGYLVRVD